ncbi:MAG: S-layer family protein [Calothrix sp. MO_192.B10]|nr:S-layer family protein [Calothrix sp. MO_192.B10]
MVRDLWIKAIAVRRFLWNIAVVVIQCRNTRPGILQNMAFMGCSIIILWSNSVCAQIQRDNTLGNAASTVTPNVNIKGLPADRIDGGARRGANLFHSFSEFNVRDAQRVYFANPTGVENILTRVTGGKVSNILGTLGVDGGANLFLVNPSGILFGENARLDVGGSFVGSTANGIQFGDRNFFSATNPEVPSPLLTVNPSALFFNQVRAGRIENRSIAPAGDNLLGLRVPDGRSLLLVGGNILMDGGRLNSLNGQVELAGIAGDGIVGLNFDANNLSLNIPDGVARDDILLTNRSRIDVRGVGTGSITFNTRNLKIDKGSFLYAGINSNLGSLDTQGKDIKLNTQGAIAIDNGSVIFNSVFFGAVGNAGQILIEAKGPVSIFGDSVVFNYISPAAIGTVGGIVLQAESFSLTEGSNLITSTRGQGNAGNMTIDVRGSVSFDGIGDSGFASGLFATVFPSGVGRGGDIKITAGSLSITDGARIQNKSEGLGNTGNVNLEISDRIFLDGEDKNPNPAVEHLTGIFTTVQTNTVQKGGDIKIKTGSLTIFNGAQLTANTFGRGDSGNVTIEARDRIFFDGFKASAGISTGAFTVVGRDSRGNVGEGKGGDIRIFADSLALGNGAVIAAATLGKGDAGKVTIVTQDGVSLDGIGRNGFLTEILTSVEPGAIGSANDIDITTNSFSLTNGGQLRTTTSGELDAGNIRLKVQDNITLSGSDTGIFANTTLGSTGKGGSIFIEPQTVTIRDGAKIAVDSQGTGIGGNIQLFSGFLTLDNGIISAQTLSNTGGNINLGLNNLLLLRNGSQISTTAGSDRFGGDGGNITINSPFIVAFPQENSDITANAFRGRGGKIDIITNGIFGIQPRPSLTELSDITASSELGVSGEVSINTPNVDPARGLSELPENIVDAAGLINQNLCTAARQGSEFIVTGRGGLPVSPTELLNPHATWEDWNMGVQQEQSQPKPGKPSNQLQPKSQSSPPIIETRGWILDGQGNVMLTAKPVTVTRQGTWLHPLDCQRLQGE